MATYESKRYAIIPINADQIADGTVSNSEFQTVDTTSSINTQLGTKVPLAGGTMTGNLAPVSYTHLTLPTILRV